MPTSPAREIDPRDAFICGAAFELTSLLVATQDYLRMAEVLHRKDDVRSLPLHTTGIVNSAFALELYFKSLIWIERGASPKPIRDHKLLTLFNAISSTRQQRIRELFDEETANHPWWVRVKTRFPSELPNYQIPRVFESANNAFTEHRYYFEGIKTANMCYFAPAVPATRQVILEINPGWLKFVTQLPGSQSKSSAR